MYTIGQLTKSVRNLLAESDANFFTDAEIRGWLNSGIEELWKTIRTNKEDQFVKQMKSTDSSVFLFDQTFDPATLKIVSGQSEYTLPPDFVDLKYIRPLSTNLASSVKFTPVDAGNSIFDYQDATDVTTSTDFIFDVIGNQLFLAPQPGTDIEIKIGYTYRLSPLRIASDLSGTISIVAGGTAVVGVGTNFDSTYILNRRLIAGNSSEVLRDVDRIYPYISSVGSTTALTLSGVYDQQAIATLSKYSIEDALSIQLTDYKSAIVDYAVMRAKYKDKSAQSFKEIYELFQRGEAKTKESSANRASGVNMVDPYL